MASRARSASPTTSGASPPPSFAGFVVRLLLYLFLSSLAFSLGQMHLHMRPVQEAMSSSVTVAANLLGANAEVESTIIKTKHAALEINHECTGIFVLLVYAMFVLAYPAPWWHRASGIAIGFSVLMLINLARLVVLTMIASNYPDWFPYFHEYFFQGLFIALL